MENIEKASLDIMQTLVKNNVVSADCFLQDVQEFKVTIKSKSFMHPDALTSVEINLTSPRDISELLHELECAQSEQS